MTDFCLGEGRIGPFGGGAVVSGEKGEGLAVAGGVDEDIGMNGNGLDSGVFGRGVRREVNLASGSDLSWPCGEVDETAMEVGVGCVDEFGPEVGKGGVNGGLGFKGRVDVPDRLVGLDEDGFETCQSFTAFKCSRLVTETGCYFC